MSQADGWLCRGTVAWRQVPRLDGRKGYDANWKNGRMMCRESAWPVGDGCVAAMACA